MIIKTNGFKMPNGDIHTFIPPSPTKNERGGIKAKAKTTEALEVAFDEASERLYAAIPNTDKTLSETGVAADAKTTGDKIKDKLDRNQGIEHYGKSLIVGEDGLVVPGEVQSGGDGIAIINTMSGESPLAIPDSAERVNKRLELGGKTEQVKTTGAQLLPFPYVTGDMTKNGVTFAVQEDGGIKVTGTATEFVIFNIAKIDFGANSIFNNSAGNGKVLSGGKDNVKIEYHGLNKNTYLSIEKGLTVNTVIYPQLQNGTAATPYEPYTGGKPSPSPEYPQEIKNVGKWNEETQKYEIDVKVTGRNLFNGKLSKGKFITDDMNVVSDLATMNTFDKPVEIEPNTDYVISANGVIWEGNINVYDENGKKIVQHFTGKFKTPSNAKYIRASISNARAPIDSKIQMEYGTAMNEFEQYHQPQVLTLTSDRPITKWDKLVEQGGEIGWLYKSKIIDGFDGQSSNITLGGKQGKVQHFSVVFADTPNGNGNGDIYVDRYRAIAMSYTKAEFGICCNWNSGVKFFSAPNENVTTVQEFKTWLAENPLVLVYETTSTEFIPLPQPEQNAIRALKTYYPTTVITNDQGCTMELDYVADTKNYIDNKFAQLQKSLINTNTQLL